MTSGSAQQGSILLVDDTPTNLEILVGYFSDSGFDVSVATSGEGALEQVAESRPDLILLDVMAPLLRLEPFLQDRSTRHCESHGDASL